MKYISFAIPSYNSENYMSHAIETILTGGEDVEIIEKWNEIPKPRRRV